MDEGKTATVRKDDRRWMNEEWWSGSLAPMCRAPHLCAVGDGCDS